MSKRKSETAEPVVLNPSPAKGVFVPFDQLHEVIGVRYTRMSIWRMVRDRTFPAPRQLSPQRVAWSLEDLLAWTASRPVARSVRRRSLEEQHAE